METRKPEFIVIGASSRRESHEASRAVISCMHWGTRISVHGGNVNDDDEERTMWTEAQCSSSSGGDGGSGRSNSNDNGNESGSSVGGCN
ncbi:hypothetical protein EAG_13411 [Camponotus floridanus]|uniref:Uncharacterized protein n=1 Tax=Camponotus floridanus TaxID=104421 RepID=E2A240_CAMFO|nr:hypothetical protein EAG_13411 [Camponotus floridanus]